GMDTRTRQLMTLAALMTSEAKGEKFLPQLRAYTELWADDFQGETFAECIDALASSLRFKADAQYLSAMGCIVENAPGEINSKFLFEIGQEAFRFTSPLARHILGQAGQKAPEAMRAFFEELRTDLDKQHGDALKETIGCIGAAMGACPDLAEAGIVLRLLEEAHAGDKTGIVAMNALRTVATERPDLISKSLIDEVFASIIEGRDVTAIHGVYFLGDVANHGSPQIVDSSFISRAMAARFGSEDRNVVQAMAPVLLDLIEKREDLMPFALSFAREYPETSSDRIARKYDCIRKIVEAWPGLVDGGFVREMFTGSIFSDDRYARDGALSALSLILSEPFAFGKDLDIDTALSKIGDPKRGNAALRALETVYTQCPSLVTREGFDLIYAECKTGGDTMYFALRTLSKTIAANPEFVRGEPLLFLARTIASSVEQGWRDGAEESLNYVLAKAPELVTKDVFDVLMEGARTKISDNVYANYSINEDSVKALRKVLDFRADLADEALARDLMAVACRTENSLTRGSAMKALETLFKHRPDLASKDLFEPVSIMAVGDMELFVRRNAQNVMMAMLEIDRSYMSADSAKAILGVALSESGKYTWDFPEFFRDNVVLHCSLRENEASVVLEKILPVADKATCDVVREGVLEEIRTNSGDGFVFEKAIKIGMKFFTCRPDEMTEELAGSFVREATLSESPLVATGLLRVLEQSVLASPDVATKNRFAGVMSLAVSAENAEVRQSAYSCVAKFIKVSSELGSTAVLRSMLGAALSDPNFKAQFTVLRGVRSLCCIYPRWISQGLLNDLLAFDKKPGIYEGVKKEARDTAVSLELDYPHFMRDEEEDRSSRPDPASKAGGLTLPSAGD
ncbi:MAG: hypothetical protein PHE27_05300, partial [Alphaproteobacteria bacterium]|nr:hypothetical protein [Alphaproteobacteria bacterium]